MRPVTSAEAVREAEAEYFAAHPGIDLMAKAASQVAEHADLLLGERRRVLVVAGPGNNGGDALFAAAVLAARGRQVSCWLAMGRGHEDGLAAARDSGCVGLTGEEALAEAREADLVIDGVTGIGGRPGLPADVASLAGVCARSGVPVLSIDLPSGLDADSCPAGESFIATRTLTFAAEKFCHVARPAADRCGEVHVADIGLTLGEPSLWQAEESDLAACWPAPDGRSDKYSRGVVGLDTGSELYPGAGVLGVLGALCSGAGMVRYLGPARAEVLAAAPSVVAADGRVQALVVGSGWGGPDAKRFDAACQRGVPLIVDAEALRHLPGALPPGSLLTPHAGELALLLGVVRAEVEADPVSHVRAAATQHAATVLLKGASQYVAGPCGRVSIALPGPAWTAQAGSGDVLAGICGTLLAAGVEAEAAALAAAGLQALTAGEHPGPHPPDRIAREMPDTLARLLARNAAVRSSSAATS
ncbi:MAG: NAD(P)H-hydrate epimerase [Propionibacteriaceae bacterium]|nr:NAD(P)H-hydrate epimerase [Propionibacteriaceae bacterium]